MEFPSLNFGDLFSKIPIIQGGMGVGISLSGLASAVANEGGIGVIAAAMIGMGESDIFSNPLEAHLRAIRREIQKAREMTTGVLGINIMVALTNYKEMVATAINEKIDIIFAGAGLPLDLPAFLKEGVKTKLVPIVSSGKAASIICKRWLSKFDYLPDGFVVEGPLAGGHLGFKPEEIDDPAYRLENLVTAVIEAVKPFEEKLKKAIPVIAAGGIYTGEDIKRFLGLGAAGVQMGTRFVATKECDASENFKQTYIQAKEEDITIIKSPVGLPGRAIRNKFISDANEGKKTPFRCPHHCITTCDYQHAPYCIAAALINAQKGKLDHGFAFSGQNVSRVSSIVTVKELIDSLKEEFSRAFDISPALLQPVAC